VNVKNNTKDSIKILFGNRPIVDSFYIEPDSIIEYFSSGTDSNQGFIKDVLFEGGYVPFKTRARVYVSNHLMVDWEGPAEDKDSLHHFYNYNSWETWLVDESNGIAMFTIYESDLEY
jgi:hypothetical protein